MQNPPKSRRRPSLSNDIIFEILVRLPAKSIGRFRCVSKRWLSDLTDPNFIRAHSSSSPTSGFFLFTSTFNRAEHIPFDSESRLSDPTLSFLDNDGLSPEFFDCCNGLILCGKPYRSSHRKITYALAVCNPLTRECRIIPVPDSVFSKEAFLAFDPLVSPHFKVVSVCGGVDMFIYSSETRKWKLLTKNLRTEYNNIHFGRSTPWNGNLVWNSFRGSSLCLDVRSEQLKWLPLPVAREDCWCRYRGESGGRLHFIGKPVPVTHESITHFDIWELTAGSTEWSVLYRIDIEHIKDVYPEVKARVPSHSEDRPDLRLEVVHFFRDEGGVGDRLLLSVPGKIACYHLQDKSFTTVCNGLPVYRHRVVYSWQFFHPHAHTLSPLNDNDNENAAISSHQDWICWPSEHDQLLMDLMIENSLKGQKGRSGFRIGAWRDMVDKLNENAQLKYDVSHLKNRLMSYRRDYCNVSKMLTYRGFSWDPVQQMVVAGDAEWRVRLKWNCGAALFRRKRVPFKKLEIICASLTRSCQETKLPKVADAEIIAKDDEGSEAQVDPAIQQDDEGNGKETQDISGAESVHGAETTKLLFDNCLEELDAMEDVDNDLYVKALFIFKEEYNQHVFLKTKGVRRLMWLREAARHLNCN